MSYVASIPVEFPHPAHVVYEALCDLGRHPQWNTGMSTISHTGHMKKGLIYTTRVMVMGRVNQSTVEVIELVPDKLIVLESKTGLVDFRVAFAVLETDPKACIVTCDLRFMFSNAVFNLARPVVEAITETRIRGDLETLRAFLSETQ
jgi:uncharacterized protein YndB with AHSA1/START domain